MSDSDRGYYFIDGSTLLSHITWLWKNDARYNKIPLNINVFAESLKHHWGQYSGPIVRINFYFRKGDPRLKTHIIVPKTNIPGQKNHWEIIECAERNKMNSKLLGKILADYPEASNYLIPQEKGLDMRLACDALLFLGNNRATCEVLYVNDSDYIPLIQSIKNLGGNIYLSCLTKDYPVAKALCEISDMFLTLESDLDAIFKTN